VVLTLLYGPEDVGEAATDGNGWSNGLNTIDGWGGLRGVKEEF
jgi:hypothetical protein